jgi:hypothetical protein
VPTTLHSPIGRYAGKVTGAKENDFPNSDTFTCNFDEKKFAKFDEKKFAKFHHFFQ